MCDCMSDCARSHVWDDSEFLVFRTLAGYGRMRTSSRSQSGQARTYVQALSQACAQLSKRLVLRATGFCVAGVAVDGLMHDMFLRTFSKEERGTGSMSTCF